MPSSSTPASATPSDPPETPKAKRPKRRWRWVRRIAIAVAVFVLLLVALFFLIQTQAGKDWVAARINGVLANPDMTIKVGGISGTIPTHFTVGSVTISDREGTWLEIEDAALSWRPLSLFRRTVYVKALEVERVTVLRTPLPAEEPEEKPEKPPLTGQGVLDMVEGIPNLQAVSLAVNRVELAEGVLPEALNVQVMGNLATEKGGRRALGLRVDGLDEAPLRLAVDGAIDVAGKALTLNATLDEPAGGVIGRLAKLPDDQPLALKLITDGPLTDLPLSLSLSSGDTTLFLTSGQLAALDEVSTDLTGELSVPPSMRPESAGMLLTEPVEFFVHAGIDKDRTGAEANARFTGAGAEITLGGEVALGAKTLDATVDLNVPDAAVYSDVAKQPLGGSLTLNASASGPFDALQFRLTIDAPQFSRAETEVEGIRLALQGALSPTDDGPALTVTGDGQIATVRDPKLPELASPFAELTFNVDRSEADGLRVTLPIAFPALGGQVQLTNTSDAAAESGNFALDANLPDVKALAALAGLDGSGRLVVRAEGAYNRPDGSANVVFNAEGGEIAGFHEAVAAVVGDHFAIDLEAGIANDTVTAPVVNVASGNLSATASGAYGIEEKSTRAEFEVDLARLEDLSELAKRPLGGHLVAKGTVAHTADELTTDIQGQVDALRVDEREFEGFTFDVQTEGPPASAAGTARLALWDVANRFETETRFAREGDGVRVPEFALDGPGIHAEGEAAWPGEPSAASARLSLQASDLAQLGAFLGIDLAGTADVEATLSAENGQRLVAEASATALRVPGAVLESLNLEASLREPLTAPAGSAEIAVVTLHAGSVRVETIDATVTGTGDRVTLETSVVGSSPYGFDLTNTTTVALEEEGQTVRLAALQGHIEDVALELTQPGAIRIRDGGFDAEPIALSVGEGGLALEGSMNASDVDLNVKTTALPLSLAAQFGGPPLDGALDATLTVQGAKAAPVARLDAAVNGLRPLGDRAEDGEPLDLVLATAVEQGGVTARLEASGMAGEPSTVDLSIPATFSLAPFAFEVAQNAPLAGTVSLHADTERIAPIALPSSQSMRGVLLGDLTLGGTIQRPLVNGTLAMDGGYYENVDTGTVLEDIRLDALLEGQSIVLRTLDVADGEGGTVHAEGEASLSPNVAFAIDTKLSTARLVRLDVADAVVDGTLSVKGTDAGAEVNGELVVTPVHVRIPGSSGPDVPSLEVREAAATPEGEEPDTMEDEEPPPYPVTTNITVDMPRQVYVEGRGLKSEWMGRVAIVGDIPKPNLEGELKIIEGSLDFMGKSFQLVNCAIRFDGPPPPDPVIGITAQREQKDLVARLRVLGTVSSPQIRLESEPQLPQDEILAYVLFGRPLDDLGPGQALQVARAARALSGAGGSGGGLTGGIQQSLGLDTLNFDTSGGLGAASVGIGKQFSDRIYIEVNQGLGDAGSSVSASMDVTDEVTVEATTSAGGQGGAAIKYKRDY